MPRLFEQKIKPLTRSGADSSNEIIECYDKPVIVYPEPDNKDIFYVSSDLVVSKKIDRRKYVNSFAGDVGVLNVVKKLALQGEVASDGRFAAPAGYFDGTVLPIDGEKMINLARAKAAIWAKLDPELKASMTFEDFAASFNNEKLKAYIMNKAAKKAGVKPLDKKAPEKVEPSKVDVKKEGE